MHIIKKETSKYNRSMWSSKGIRSFKGYIWKQNRRRIKEELSYAATHWDDAEDFDIMHITMNEVKHNWWYQW